jgi:RimJ/RimL family protein N-acetyltransferase
MKYFKQVIGEKCYLSPTDPADAAQYCEWINDLGITMNLEPTISVSVEAEANLIRELQSKHRIFSIIDLYTDELLGSCGMHDIDLVNGLAMFGIFIGRKDHWNKGYGVEATSLCLDFGFNVLNLHNIYLIVVDYNPRAIRCYEKAGFKTIGRRREARHFGGKRHDLILMDILSTEFTSPYVKGLIK